MKRHMFLQLTSLEAAGGLAGCLSPNSPPPRKSSVVFNFEISDDSFVVDFVDQVWVMPRYEAADQPSLSGFDPQSLTALNPVGVVGAKGEGDGGGGCDATGYGIGSYVPAPRTVHGHTWYHGGDYTDDWYESNAGKASRFPVGVTALGIVYLGSTAAICGSAPDAGPVPWDREIQNPNGIAEYDMFDGSQLDRDSWYRVGAYIVGDDVSHDFRWECYDLEITDGIDDAGYSIEEEWKASPRIRAGRTTTAVVTTSSCSPRPTRLPSMSSTRTDTATLLTLTFAVSFCSFTYEFVYSELLTMMYGGTVTQYVTTVGLYFFNLGIGAMLSDDLDGETLDGNFFRAKVLLAVTTPAGFLLIIDLNSVRAPQAMPAEPAWTAACLPAAVVGFLSGFELPLLTYMFDDLDDDGLMTPSWLWTAGTQIHDFVIAVVGTLWTVERVEGCRSGLSVVLAMDYVGGLTGAVVYARVLYPGIDLIPAIFVLAPLNGVAALVFVTHFGTWSWWPLGGDETSASADTGGNAAASARTDGSDRSPSTARVSETLFVVYLLLMATYAGIVTKYDAADERPSWLCLEQQVENEYPSGAIHATVTSQETTVYQHVTRYNRTWTGIGPNLYSDGWTERCLHLGAAVQFCENWTDSYHEGLVNMPISLVDPGPDTKVLAADGGDWIAVDHLRGYGVTVDHVNLDGEFMRDAKTDPLFTRWYDDAYEYGQLNTTVTDGYHYLQKTNETYDLVLLDIPGAIDDNLPTLYSTGFYRFVRTCLSEDGVAVMWDYLPDAYPEYYKALVDAVGAAGFAQELSYRVHEGLDDSGETERVEQSYVFAPGGHPRLTGGDATQYVRARREHHGAVEWHAVPHYRGVRKNSIFRPSYGVLVDT